MFAELLKTHRKALNLTQWELAEKTGISRTHIAQMETAKRCPSVEQEVALQRILRRSKEWDAVQWVDAALGARIGSKKDLRHVVEDMQELRTRFLAAIRLVRELAALLGDDDELPKDLQEQIRALEQPL